MSSFRSVMSTPCLPASKFGGKLHPLPKKSPLSPLIFSSMPIASAVLFVGGQTGPAASPSNIHRGNARHVEGPEVYAISRGRDGIPFDLHDRTRGANGRDPHALMCHYGVVADRRVDFANDVVEHNPVCPLKIFGCGNIVNLISLDDDASRESAPD